jgi:tetraacyldisaccharide 4'-kinase
MKKAKRAPIAEPRKAGWREALARDLNARWYGARAPWWLLPLSALFAGLSGLRRLFYRWGVLKVEHVSARVVVIGNIAVGGSGKTPLVLWLARELAASGVKVGVVTRGYGGSSNEVRAVTPDDAAPVVGDEALLLARETGLPVVAGRDRVGAARQLVAQCRPDVILSDDGMQHYRLGRDVEIAVVDARRGFGNGALLPAGPLREPRGRLENVNAIVTKGHAEVALPTGIPVFEMASRLGQAMPLAGGEPVSLGHFRGERVVALAAIADPEGFFTALEAAGLLVERHALADHAPLAAELATLATDRPIFMTDKDAVKLDNPPANAWRVPLAIAFSDTAAARLVALARGAHTVTEEN